MSNEYPDGTLAAEMAEKFVAQSRDAAREFYEHPTEQGFFFRDGKQLTGELVCFKGTHASLEIHGLSLAEVEMVFRVLRTGHGA